MAVHILYIINDVYVANLIILWYNLTYERGVIYMRQKRTKIFVLILFIIIFLLVFVFTIHFSSKINTKKIEIADTNIEKIEEPMIPENENKVFNIKNSNSEISTFFPANIREITMVSCISAETNPTTYTINTYDKMKELTDLFLTTSWEKDTTHYSPEWLASVGKDQLYKAMWQINFIGDTTIQFNMLGTNGNGFGKVNVEGIETIYNISENNYRDILSFNDTKYYLHKSDFKKPEQDKCYNAQSKALEGLNETEINNISKQMRCNSFKYRKFIIGWRIYFKR